MAVWGAIAAAAISAASALKGSSDAADASDSGADAAAAFQNRALDTSVALARPQLEVGTSALGVLASLFGLPPPSDINFNALGSSGAGREGIFQPGSSLSGQQQAVVDSFTESFGFDPTLDANKERILGLDQTRDLPSNRLKEDFAAFQSTFGFDPSRREGNPFFDPEIQQSQQTPAGPNPAVTLESLIADNPIISFNREQGEQAISRGAAARGLNESGGTLKDLVRFNQDLSGQGVQQFVLNPLFELAGFGARGSTQLNQSVQNTGTNLSNIALGRADARSSAFQNRGNIIGNTVGDIFDIVNNRQRATT